MNDDTTQYLQDAYARSGLVKSLPEALRVAVTAQATGHTEEEVREANGLALGVEA
jgi:hypothetical protein